MRTVYHSHVLPAAALPAISFLHQSALTTLSKQPRLPFVPEGGFSASKTLAKAACTNSGNPWPEVFDQEFPEPCPHNEGVTYEFANLNGLPYLRLTTPEATPTVLQLHCLTVLTHTFPLLALPVSSADTTQANGFHNSTGINPNPMYAPLHLGALNANVQQGALHRHGIAPGPQIRAIPIRAIITPLLLLCLRAFLLLYFFSPARKPLLGIMLGTWMVYEAWGAIRGAMVDLNGAERAGGAVPQDAGPVPAAEVRPQPPQPERNHGDAVLSSLAELNLNSEALALEPPEGVHPIQEPGVLQKVKMFVGLFVLTLHPAVWNRRRTALREREGRVRTVLNAVERSSESQQDAQEDPRGVQARMQVLAQHERRPVWIRNYMDRIRRGEWEED